MIAFVMLLIGIAMIYTSIQFAMKSLMLSKDIRKGAETAIEQYYESMDSTVIEQEMDIVLKETGEGATIPFKNKILYQDNEVIVSGEAETRVYHIYRFEATESAP